MTHPCGHPRTAKPPPSPDSKLSPKTLVMLSGLINISQHQYSDDRNSWTSVTSTSSQQQALVLHLRVVLKVSRMKVNHLKVNKHFILSRSNIILIWFEVFLPACLFMRTSSYNNNRSHDLLTLSKSWSIQHYGLKPENIQLCLTLCLAVLPEHVLNRHVLR